MTHMLYRHFDASDRLLYVGITNNPPRRAQQHSESKNWWRDVRKTTMQPFDTRPEVLAAEAKAIADESPLWNVKRPTPDKKRTYSTPETKRLTWRCDTCGKFIANGDGYLHVNDAELQAAEEGYEVWREDTHNGDIWAPDEPWSRVRWMSHHYECDPNPNPLDIRIDVEAARSNDDLLAFTIKWIGEEWLPLTNWRSLVRWATASRA